MIHIVYKTTCTVTNRFYIGVHSSMNVDDGYLGSGNILKASVAKYGKENHTREILKIFETSKEAYLYEKELVTPSLVSTDLCMNIAPGGMGGIAITGAGPRRMAELWRTDPEWKSLFSIALSEGLKKAYQSGKHSKWGFTPEDARVYSKRALSEESRAKRLATFKRIGHAKGERNSQFGTCWVSNDRETVKINKEDLEYYISKGYVRGRKLVLTPEM